jgi:hypothetical protein
MSKTAQRGLSPGFLADLQAGLLAPVRERVERDKSLCLEIRQDYVNVYYRGGNAMRISLADGGYLAFFDTKYFPNVVPPMPPPQVMAASDVSAWLTALPMLKEAIDLAQPGEEREVQQLILRDNNVGGLARSTDYYVCDIEYANKHGRFDLVAVRWPSTPAARKRQYDHRLVLGEVKFGDGALNGKAGLHAHVTDVNAYLAKPGNLDALKQEMLLVFNQKRSLGLIDCEKDLLGFGDEPPMLLLVIVNHDPDKSRLRQLLRTLPPSPHAELRIATGSLLGYGLYDPAIHPVEEALAHFEAYI